MNNVWMDIFLGDAKQRVYVWNLKKLPGSFAKFFDRECSGKSIIRWRERKGKVTKWMIHDVDSSRWNEPNHLAFTWRSLSVWLRTAWLGLTRFCSAQFDSTRFDSTHTLWIKPLETTKRSICSKFKVLKLERWSQQLAPSKTFNSKWLTTTVSLKTSSSFTFIILKGLPNTLLHKFSRKHNQTTQATFYPFHLN